MSTSQVRPIQVTDLPAPLKGALAGIELYGIGNIGLLREACIGLCGSRDASERALRWAYDFGREAARQQIVVVSGYARGVDREAHRGALDGGGSTIAVLPEGIQYFRVPRELKGLIDFRRNFLAISMFEPNAPWKVWRAMERNKLIVGLSAGIFVIEAREKGGTINAAYESLKQGRRLWAVAYADKEPGRAGNRKLLAGAALPIKHLKDLKPALEDAAANPPTHMRDLVLNVTGPDRD